MCNVDRTDGVDMFGTIMTAIAVPVFRRMMTRQGAAASANLSASLTPNGDVNNDTVMNVKDITIAIIHFYKQE